MSPTTTTKKLLLDNSNFSTWKGNTAASLREVGCWRVVEGSALVPDPSDHPFEYEKYCNTRDKAASIIYNALEDGQKAHVKGKEGDAKEMWRILESVHSSKKPGTRFTGYDTLFSIRLRSGESLPDLITRVGNTMASIKDQRPDKFDLDTLDDELYSMALIRSLPSSYDSLKDAIMLLDDLSPSTISEAFRNRSSNDQKRAENDDSIAIAMAAASPPSCLLCNAAHRTEQCPGLSRAQQTARQSPEGWRQRQNGQQQRQNNQQRSNNQQSSQPKPEGAAVATAAPPLSSSSSSTFSGPAEHAGKAATVRSTSPSGHTPLAVF